MDESQRDQRYQQTRQALRAMKRILTHFRVLMDDELRPQGVTTAQMQVLFAVRNTPGSSGAQLARSCYITPQTTQALLKHLEEAGFIVRGKDPVNDRIVTARITPAGERLVQSVEKTVRGLQAGLWQGVTDSELTRFNALLERCLCNLDIADESAGGCR
ncbi:DNA-binding MarR family transcriptional regulator [Edaphobacter modestus]|uniref:DNA-binding MarR family transcriptional regulator n=1 Tax=Edaphobacter modestus TaxID=388466 RepID=A0A4V2G534_9BACT|nr:DNA-binding MarR family transcriptional regulator [Edaphobacter modestus]